MSNEVQKVLWEARAKAVEAKENYLTEWLAKTGGNECNEPMYCGFAWVDVRARINSKLGKLLLENGFRKSYRSGVLTLWDPSRHNGQSMDVKMEGAKAYAKHLTDNGIPCEWSYRAD